MTNFKWSILEIYQENEQISKVKFLLKAEDESNFVETEGYHSFSQGTVDKNYEETREEDLVRWVDQETTKDEVNIIKLNLEKQLESLKNSKKVELPWVANTFSIE